MPSRRAPQSPLDVACQPPQGFQLARALLTTYDPPDAEVLLKDFLPGWLGMSRRSGGLGENPALFLAESASLLNRASKSIAIFHSQGTPYLHPWLWTKYVRPFPIDPAYKQHAKLWLLHWVPTTSKPKRQELLQIVVSSLNLTSAALSGQVQAIWHATIALEGKGKSGQWSPLDEFLAELAKAVANAELRKEATEHAAYFSALLSRARPPAGASFVASIPTGKGPLPLKRLRKLLSVNLPTKVDILTPFVGAWSGESLREWCHGVLGGTDGKFPKGARLCFLKEERKETRWYLAGSLPKSPDTRILKLVPSSFADRHEDDRRWTHAKLYQFSGGRKGKSTPRTLITSANFTPSAWGNDAAGTRPRNFELGVLVSGRAFDFDVGKLETLEPPQVDERAPPSTGSDSASAATWDGTEIRLDWNGNPAPAPDKGICRVISDVRRGDERGVKVPPRRHGHDALVVDWPLDNPMGRPVRVAWEGQWLAVIWIGAAGDPSVEGPVDPKIPEAHRLALEAALIEEEFGGRPADRVADALSGDGGGEGDGGIHEGPADGVADALSEGHGSGGGTGVRPGYHLEWLEKARELSLVIDGWTERVAGASDWAVCGLVEDGQRLARLWRRLAEQTAAKQPPGKKRIESGVQVAYRIAAEELAVRLASREGAK